MYQDYQIKPKLLTKCLLAALFVGIFAVLADEFYNFIYRAFTSFMPSEIINVSSLIFGTLIIFMIAGILYFMLIKFTAKPDLFFIAIMLLLTAAGFMLGLQANRSGNAEINTAFRGLLTGVELIIGLMATFLIPYFVKHYRIFV